MEIVDDDQNEIYSAKVGEDLDQVNEVNKTLASTLDDLGMTGTEMAVEYVADAQKSVIEKVRKTITTIKTVHLLNLISTRLLWINVGLICCSSVR